MPKAGPWSEWGYDEDRGCMSRWRQRSGEYEWQDDEHQPVETVAEDATIPRSAYATYYIPETLYMTLSDSPIYTQPELPQELSAIPHSAELYTLPEQDLDAMNQASVPHGADSHASVLLSRDDVQDGNRESRKKWVQQVVVYNTKNRKEFRYARAKLDTGNEGDNLITTKLMKAVQAKPQGRTSSVSVIGGRDVKIGGEVMIHFSGIKPHSDRYYDEMFRHTDDLGGYDMLLSASFMHKTWPNLSPPALLIRSANGRKKNQDQVTAQRTEEAIRFAQSEEAARYQDQQRAEYYQREEEQRQAQQGNVSYPQYYPQYTTNNNNYSAGTGASGRSSGGSGRRS